MAADPRPPKRIRDPKLMKQMHLEGGVCALCAGTRGLTLHHILSRGSGRGDDRRENLMWLCQGPQTWNCHTAVEEREEAVLEAVAQIIVRSRPDTLVYLTHKLDSWDAAIEFLRRRYLLPLTVLDKPDLAL